MRIPRIAYGLNWPGLGSSWIFIDARLSAPRMSDLGSVGRAGLGRGVLLVDSYAHFNDAFTCSDCTGSFRSRWSLPRRTYQGA